ncbi:methyltransferase [Mesoterricola silvestris]|uniref:Methyltransferase n=1 Tax=Mesoterricola silvestris TaxID=2927979 RepID=A0AA48GSU5_9BACT|nr:methyltransferase [Mesoterricola silvestris]BDU73650.1 methyltransferase [Mesoterricola silvestris]
MTFTFDPQSADCSGALARLGALGFTEAAVAGRLGLEDLNDLQWKAVPVYRQDRLADRDALASAIDLFVLQGSLEARELGRLFDPGTQGALVRAGILERAGALVRARASVYPVGSTLIFSDHAWAESGDVPRDQVMYVGTDSRWLARATVRKPVEASLDLCCGSGIQALLAAAHAGTATAVDINARAVACTAFNARAQGLANLEALQGDLYAPVGARRFGLITANPPFVPAPAQAVDFRDGGPSGEDVQRRIVQGLPRHLAPGGLAQIVTELGEREGEPLEDRLRGWLDGAPMALHILRLRVHPAQAYAIGHAQGDDNPTFLASVGRWHANLRAQGYDRIVSVLLAFQWSDDPWTRVDEALAPARDAGGELEALFAAQRLARDPGLRQRLEGGRVALAGPVALLEARALGMRVPPTTQARLAAQAMPVEHPLAPLERDLLERMDPEARVADLLAAAAAAGLGSEAVLDALVALVRRGLVRPA